MATLIFDFDGTLVDSFKLLITLFNEQAQQANFREIRKRDIPILKDISANEAMKYLQISFHP